MTLTIDQLVTWLISMGLPKVDPRPKQLTPETAASWRDQGVAVDSGDCVHLSHAPEAGGYFTIKRDDSSHIRLHVHPWDHRDEVAGCTDADYSPANVMFMANGAGEVLDAAL